MLNLSTIDVSATSGAMTPFSKLNEVRSKLGDTMQSITALESSFIALLVSPVGFEDLNSPIKNDRVAKELKAKYQKILQDLYENKVMVLGKLSEYSGLKKVLEGDKYYLEETIKENKKHAEKSINDRLVLEEEKS